MTTAYLSLGSNLGRREELLRRAIRLLESDSVRVTRLSGVYETEPLGPVAQPWFLNLVVEIQTSLEPLRLLEHTQKVELMLGRRRDVAGGPRTADIDILLYGEVILATAELVIPHPRLSERRFVLEPLAELAPALRHPETKLTVAEMLAQVRGQSVRRVEAPLFKV